MIGMTTLVTGAAAAALAAVFLFGAPFHALRDRIRDQGALASWGGGVSTAYVFVHMMPELGEARAAYARSATVADPFKGMAVYLTALFGFLLYYGLDNIRRQLREQSEGRDNRLDYRIHLAGYAAYVSMIAYMLINRLEATPMAIGLYTLAMVAHFLTIDHVLHEQHGGPYDRGGRLFLALTTLAGWAAGLLYAAPPYALSLMIAFVSGAIIMNSAIGEISHRQGERFVAFIAGALIYAALLVPLG